MREKKKEGGGKGGGGGGKKKDDVSAAARGVVGGGGEKKKMLFFVWGEGCVGGERSAARWLRRAREGAREGTGKTILEKGGKAWFFLQRTMRSARSSRRRRPRSSKRAAAVVGSVRAPLGTSDFSSYLLQAQGSGAQVVGLANAGADFSNSLKAAHEFGLTNTMKPAALLAFITDINAVGLETAQGLYRTAGWYWDLNDKSRALEAFLKKRGAPTIRPLIIQRR